MRHERPDGMALVAGTTPERKGVEDPSETYAELGRCARDEILRSGGSLSHHHGVGKLRQGFLPRVLSRGALEWAAALKAVDPENVLGAGNLTSSYRTTSD